MDQLSDSALALLRLHLAGGGAVDPYDSGDAAYRELEAAGFMILSRPFTGPRRYIPTRLGWKLADVLARMDATTPSP